MTGDIFKGYLMNGMFNLAGLVTGQSIQLLGMLTEAVHTPHVHDRYLAIKNAKYVFNTARDLGNEIAFKPGGIVETRARKVLEEAAVTLEQVREIGLMAAIEEGVFAGISRANDGGRGMDGVAEKADDYWNPFEDEISARLKRNGGGACD